MPNLVLRLAQTVLRGGLAVMFVAIASHAHAETPKVEFVAGQPVLGNFDAPGYAVEEFFVSGTASSYKFTTPPTDDGHWSVAPAETVPYTTRIVVVRPTDPKKFSGTVAVEWLNVSAGADGAADWGVTHREIVRSGHAYVGVSAQKVSIEGGAGVFGPATAFLKKVNPERYGKLNHPGDAFAYDIFSQAGNVVRTQAGKVLGPLVPKRVIAVGESQSAAFLTTYVDAADPVAKVYDGFMIHSRFGSGAALDNGGMASTGIPRYVKLRNDLRVPVMTVETETDLLDNGLSGYHGARRPDSDRLRVWEIPGTAHADNYLFGGSAIDNGSASVEKLAAVFAPTDDMRGTKMAKPVNNAPQHHYVVEAALWHLDQWLKTGKAPPRAMPLDYVGAQGAPYALDANGNAKGGVRTPWVDVPTSRLSGAPNSGGQLGFLVGSSSEPYDAATLKRLYPGGKPDYLKRFQASLDSAIKAGFILPADRQEILGLAAASYQEQ